jgi:hypothetical protein
VYFRNHLVNITTCLAFTAVIVPGIGALAASEDVKKSTATQLSIAAAADLKFALDDLVKDFEGKYPGTKVNVTYGSSGNFFAQLQSGAPFDVSFRLTSPTHESLLNKAWMLMRFSFTQSVESLFGYQRVPHWMWINLESRRCWSHRFARLQSPIQSTLLTVGQR